MGKFKCQYCGDKKGKNEHGLKMHEAACPENPANKGGGKTDKTDKKPSNDKKCPDCGKAEYRLLNRRDRMEAEEITAGRRYICLECDEVW